MVRSGIEMIEELLEKVELLDRRYVIIEQMMKELLNRANGFEKPGEVPQQAAAPSLKPQVNPQTNPQMKPQMQSRQQFGQESNKTHKAVGKIKDKSGRMRSGVNITVYDDRNQVVKQTKTNRAGEWMAFLPAGRYSAEYYLKDEIHANVTFAVQAETITRVSQPEI